MAVLSERAGYDLHAIHKIERIWLNLATVRNNHWAFRYPMKYYLMLGIRQPLHFNIKSAKVGVFTKNDSKICMSIMPGKTE